VTTCDAAAHLDNGQGGADGYAMCGLDSGHDGPHIDPDKGLQWHTGQEDALRASLVDPTETSFTGGLLEAWMGLRVRVGTARGAELEGWLVSVLYSSADPGTPRLLRLDHARTRLAQRLGGVFAETLVPWSAVDHIKVDPGDDDRGGAT
jgi:hypothetical protein